MIKSNELRIGNLVLIDNKETEIYCISGMGVNDFLINFNQVSYDFDEIEPIPLTEEWLLILGFKKTVDETIDYRIRQFELNRIELIHGLTLDKELFIVMMGQEALSHIKYIHQLQNIYFSLTGEDIEIK